MQMQQCGQHTKDLVDGYNLNNWSNPRSITKQNYEVIDKIIRICFVFSLPLNLSLINE